MERTRNESLVFVAASSAIALGTLFAVTWVAGFDHVAARLHAVDPVWFATAFGAQLVAYLGYLIPVLVLFVAGGRTRPVTASATPA